MPRKEILDRIRKYVHPFRITKGKGFRLMAESLAHTDTTTLLRNVEVPSLLVWGDSDRRSPLSVAAQFRDAIPGAELAVIAGAGHVSNMEQPEAFNAHVRRFCLAADDG